MNFFLVYQRSLGVKMTGWGSGSRFWDSVFAVGVCTYFVVASPYYLAKKIKEKVKEKIHRVKK